MTFARAIITAWMASQFVEHSDWQSRAGALVIAGMLWRYVTTDPLPAAVYRGLETFKKRHMR